LRATPTKLSQNPLLPTSANPLVPSCTARAAIAAVITAAACIAISTAVALFPLRHRVACTCRLQFRHFRIFYLPAAAVRRFPYYVIRSVLPPLVSCSTEPVRAQLLRLAFTISLFQTGILDSGWIQGVCADILSHTWPVHGGDQPRTTSHSKGIPSEAR
jgi:hypothetical protein